MREAGLEDRVTVLARDYRELRGRYDKLVSIEMIEAVGWKDFGTFFERCSHLLEPNGAMLLQAITIDDRAYAVERASKSFIRTHIFPNGCLPSVEVIARCLARRTDLRLTHFEDFGLDYAETLRRWRANLDATGSSSSATTSASGGCGGCTCATARRASPSGGSASRRRCWPSRAGPLSGSACRPR